MGIGSEVFFRRAEHVGIREMFRSQSVPQSFLRQFKDLILMRFSILVGGKKVCW